MLPASSKCTARRGSLQEAVKPFARASSQAVQPAPRCFDQRRVLGVLQQPFELRASIVLQLGAQEIEPRE